jgi:hypothetical protein
MKNYVTLLTLFCILSLDNLSAQKFAAVDKSPLDVSICRENRNAMPVGKIYYSRPKLDGRTLESLVPAGKVWRLGANEATELVLYQDITVGDKNLSKGTYTLYAVPGDGKWTIVVSSDTNTWGAYSYNESKDVARVDVPTSKSASPVESFSVDFNYADGKMHFAWGDVVASLPFKTKATVK